MLESLSHQFTFRLSVDYVEQNKNVVDLFTSHFMIRTQLPVYYVHLAKTKPSAKACRVPKAVKAKKKNPAHPYAFHGTAVFVQHSAHCVGQSNIVPRRITRSIVLQ